jgi:hypothetical protein
MTMCSAGQFNSAVTCLEIEGQSCELPGTLIRAARVAPLSMTMALTWARSCSYFGVTGGTLDHLVTSTFAAPTRKPFPAAVAVAEAAMKATVNATAMKLRFAIRSSFLTSVLSPPESISETLRLGARRQFVYPLVNRLPIIAR